MRWFFRRAEPATRPAVRVEYIKRTNGELLIRTYRPGEEPVETIAEVFRPPKGSYRTLSVKRD